MAQNSPNKRVYINMQVFANGLVLFQCTIYATYSFKVLTKIAQYGLCVHSPHTHTHTQKIHNNFTCKPSLWFTIIFQKIQIFFGLVFLLMLVSECSDISIQLLGVNRHGICHGRTDIVRVKFYLPGVKQSFEPTLFVVNSLLFTILKSFVVVFFIQ